VEPVHWKPADFDPSSLIRGTNWKSTLFWFNGTNQTKRCIRGRNPTTKIVGLLVAGFRPRIHPPEASGAVCEHPSLIGNLGVLCRFLLKWLLHKRAPQKKALKNKGSCPYLRAPLSHPNICSQIWTRALVFKGFFLWGSFLSLIRNLGVVCRFLLKSLV